MYGEDEEKITLDKQTFKTLASDTRIGILKSLNVRRKTLTELAKESGMSVSTIKEHLDNLAGAELIKQVDDGHKWKYYELTRKGRGVLNPEQKKVWILLSISLFAAILTGADMITGLVSTGFSRLFSGGMMAAAETFDKLPMAAGGDAGATGMLIAIPWAHIAVIVLFLGLLSLFALRISRIRGMVRF